MTGMQNKEGRERLREWARADNVVDLWARVAALEVIAELEQAEAEREVLVTQLGNCDERAEKAEARIAELEARAEDYPALFERWSAAEAQLADIRFECDRGLRAVNEPNANIIQDHALSKIDEVLCRREWHALCSIAPASCACACHQESAVPQW